MPPSNPQTLTPMRSPMPQRSHRRKPGVYCGPTTAKKPRRSTSTTAAAAASSSEKETPTVVYTERSCSPFPNNESGGSKTPATGASGGTSMMGRSTMTDMRLAAAASSRPQPEKLFSQNSRSSSPGSKAGQSVAESDDASSNSSHDNDGSQELTTTTQGNDDADFLPEGWKDPKHLQVVSMMQNVLDSGIASVCRLRQLFPPSFFQKMDFNGTTVTRFNTKTIKRICHQTSMKMDEDECSSDDEEDKASMVKSFQAKTQKSLSPLTEMSQKHHKNSNNKHHVVYSDKEKRLAMEALLLLRWMQKDGVDTLLKEGNLARVVFGICVPASESTIGEAHDELIESYSFDISYMTPNNPSQVEVSEVIEGTGSFFQNLNGFKAGRSLSQSVVPSETQPWTQASFAFSQASRATSNCDDSQSQGHFSLSQRHHLSQSQLMASMSQSIHASTLKNQGLKIPHNRFFNLRVDFSKSMIRDELPSALKPKEHGTTLTSPVPITGGNDVKPVTGGAMVRTPLGRITESGYSGLAVDVAAHSRIVESKENDQDDEFKALSQDKSEACSSTENYRPLTQPPEKDITEREENHRETSVGNPLQEDDSPQKSCTKHVESQTDNRQDELQVGGKAFGLPYGLKRTAYILCDVRDHRITKSCMTGEESEQFKCSFYSEDLKATGKKNQWLAPEKLIPYNRMARLVVEANKMFGTLEEIAQDMKVDPGFVNKIMMALHEKENRQPKKLKRNIHMQNFR